MKLKGYGDPRFYRSLQAIADIHSKKNQDYAKGGQLGHLGNFHRTAKFTQLYPGFDWTTPFGTAIHYMLKQLDAAMILEATRRKSVTGEPVADRLTDVAIYALIAKILWEEDNGPKRHRQANKRKIFKKMSKVRSSRGTSCQSK